MTVLTILGSVALIFLILMDAFETTVLPRRVRRQFRYARFYYRITWSLWRFLALRLPAGKRRETFLSLFGPLSLLGLIATWMLGLIFGFALLHWSLGTALHGPENQPGFSSYLYLSGVTIFTLGYGDVTPVTPLGRILAVAEAGLGFGFLAVVISYLPVLNQAFSRREMTISLLDARAGSPPSAAQLLLRLARSGNFGAVDAFLAEWEHWSAELLESHLSFPMLSFYRSQHDNQSWLAAVTVILDTCALLMVGVRRHNPYQAQLTFAMARHAVVDLALVFQTPPRAPDPDRLAEGPLRELRQALREAGLDLHNESAVAAKLAELRGMYEPFVNALAGIFLFALPAVAPAEATADNWQRSAWMKRTPGIGTLPMVGGGEDHFG
jgi:voltage-gated potassium channel Kch